MRALAAVAFFLTPSISWACEVTVNPEAQPQRIAARGTTVFAGDTWLWTFDATDPSNPSLRGVLSTGSILSIAAGPSHAYLGQYASVRVVDVSNLSAPDSIATIPVPYAHGLALSGDRLYIASDNGLFVADVSDPTSPTILGSYVTNGNPLVSSVIVDPATPDHPIALQYAGGLALQKYDCSDPSAPALSGIQTWVGDSLVPSLSYPARLRRVGELLAVSHTRNPGSGTQPRLRFYDASGATIAYIGSIIDPGGRARDVSAWTAATVLWCVDGGLKHVDISDPANPVELVEAPISNPGDLAIVGGMAFLGNTALSEVDLECLFGTTTSAPQRDGTPPGIALRAGPSPFRERTVLEWYVPRATPAHLEVFDVSGRLVKVLADGTVSSGWHRSVWTPVAGRAAGVYYVRLRTGDEQQISRVIQIR